MAQLVILTVEKKDVTAISGSYAFNADRFKNVQVNGSGAKFDYIEPRRTAKWEVTETSAVVRAAVQNYDSSIRVNVYVDKIDLNEINSNIQLSFDKMVYAYGKHNDPEKTIEWYDDGSPVTERIVIPMRLAAFVKLVNDIVPHTNMSFNKTVIQNLTAVNNTVIHNWGTLYGRTVKDCTVWEGLDKVETDVSIIDTDSINVLLAAGSIANARIEIEFKQ